MRALDGLYEKRILPGMRCDPASKIVAALGGLKSVAEAAGVTPTQVQRWRMPSEKGGTGGYIPRKYHDKLTELAAAKGVDLTPAAFVDPAIVAAWPADPTAAAAPSPEAA